MTFFVFLSGADRAEKQTKCAELFAIPLAVQNSHLCSFCVPGSSHTTASSCIDVASILLLFLQEVTEPSSLNPARVSVARGRGGQGHLCGQGLLSTEEEDKEKSCCHGGSRLGLWLSWNSQVKRMRRLICDIWTISHRLEVKNLIQVLLWPPKCCVTLDTALSLWIMWNFESKSGTRMQLFSLHIL